MPKLIPVQVTIPLGRGPRAVDGFTLSTTPGLAIASLDANPKCHQWRVIHRDSGMVIGWQAGFMSKAAALSLMVKMATLTDWTAGVKEHLVSDREWGNKLYTEVTRISKEH